MTEEEIRNGLDILNEEIRLKLDTLKLDTLEEEIIKPREDAEGLFDAIDHADGTLARDEAVSPLEFGEEEEKIFSCGRCGRRICRESDLDYCGIYFCPYCGQRIDWSEFLR